MQTTIVKWGNSYGIRIPKAFFQNIKIKENYPVNIILEKEKIIITKKNVKVHKTTRERLVEFYGANFDMKRKPQKEIDWSSPVGKEV